MGLKVLVLGDRALFGRDKLKAAGYELGVVVEDSQFKSSGYFGGGYEVSQHSLGLAGTADVDGYDAIVIGNNLGTGIRQAIMLPRSVRSRTLIVWNDPPSDRDTTPYRNLGFENFAVRLEAYHFLIRLAEAIPNRSV